MRNLEELSTNAYAPIQSMVYDGWLLQLSMGATNRANCVYPLYPSKIDLLEKIDYCEKIFKENHLKPVFRLVNEERSKELDQILEQRKYQIVHRTKTMTVHPYYTECDDAYELKYSDTLSDTWLESYRVLNGLEKDNKEEFMMQLKRTTPHRLFITLVYEHNVVACASLTFEQDHMAIFDVTVAKELRKQGIGTILIHKILNIAYSKNIEQAYLFVLIDNLSAMHLYKRLGFKEAYSYHYRILMQ